MTEIQEQLPGVLRTFADRIERGEMLGLTVAAYGSIVLVMPITENLADVGDMALARRMLLLADTQLELMAYAMANGGKLNG